MQATTYTAADCTAPAITDKEKIIALLYSWVSQRPGLEFGNYGDVSAYRSEMRSITRDLHDARTMLAYVERHDSLTAERLRDAFSAFSGRLSLVPIFVQNAGYYGLGTMDSAIGYRLEYCTGQYWPTEYRKAVCAVLASAIWEFIRDECMPAPVELEPGTYAGQVTYAGMSAGDFIRRAARRELGASIARRWFR